MTVGAKLFLSGVFYQRYTVENGVAYPVFGAIDKYPAELPDKAKEGQEVELPDKAKEGQEVELAKVQPGFKVCGNWVGKGMPLIFMLDAFYNISFSSKILTPRQLVEGCGPFKKLWLVPSARGGLHPKTLRLPINLHIILIGRSLSNIGGLSIFRISAYAARRGICLNERRGLDHV